MNFFVKHAKERALAADGMEQRKRFAEITPTLRLCRFSMSEMMRMRMGNDDGQYETGPEMAQDLFLFFAKEKRA